MRDNVLAGERWKFDWEVAESFDDMLSRSITDYSGMRSAITSFGSALLRGRTDPRVLDLGASRGESIFNLIEYVNPDTRFIATEVSPAFLNILRQRFANNTQIEVIESDLRNGTPDGIFDLVLAILTIQFTPIEYRHRILRSIYESIAPGGAFIFVEKVLAPNAYLDEVFTDVYYRVKEANGYSAAQVEAKRKSLEGVLVPVTASINEDLLRTAGFTNVETIWRWGPFAGWVAIP